MWKPNADREQSVKKANSVSDNTTLSQMNSLLEKIVITYKIKGYKYNINTAWEKLVYLQDFIHNLQLFSDRLIIS